MRNLALIRLLEQKAALLRTLLRSFHSSLLKMKILKNPAMEYAHIHVFARSCYDHGYE